MSRRRRRCWQFVRRRCVAARCAARRRRRCNAVTRPLLVGRNPNVDTVFELIDIDVSGHKWRQRAVTTTLREPAP